MTGDPVDPVWFPVAVRELWEKLAAHQGVDLKKPKLVPDEDLSPEAEARRRQLDDHLGELRDEAQFRIWGLVWIGEVRAWFGDGENWRRPTQQVLQEKLTGPRDEPVPFYLDRIELNAVAEAHWSEELTSNLPNCDEMNVTRKAKRGRPLGSGSYEAEDAPLLVEMAELMKARLARSPNAAAQMVADRALGASFESKVKRLRDKFLATSSDEA